MGTRRAESSTTAAAVLLLTGASLFFSSQCLACSPAEKADAARVSTATLGELQVALAQKKTTSVKLVRSYLARISACNERLHAVIAINPNALREAEQLDRERTAGRLRGPLHGIPIVLKDNIDFAGMATTAGSLALANNLRTRNAPLVDKLLAAGMIVIAKANLSEWANFRSRGSSSGWSAVGGLTVNAYDPQRTACGSSAGSAVAVAAHLVPAAVGTETNGSIVCPASVNGVVGLKPTVGLISSEGIVPISHTQDTAGPMTGSVDDAAMLLTVMVESPASSQRTDYSAGIKRDALKGVRLGVARFIKGYSLPTDKVFTAALDLLKAQGAELVEINEFDFADARDLQLTVLLTEFKVGINAYLATAPAAVKARTLEDLIAFNRAEPRELAWFEQDLFEQSQTTRGLEDPVYKQAREKTRSVAGAQGIDRLLREHRVVALIAPTTGPAWTIDRVNGDRSSGSASFLAAVSGYPHLTVPMGRAAGLPIGLSFFGAAWSEQTLLSLGFSFEQALSRRSAQTH
jgi:amidase